MKRLKAKHAGRGRRAARGRVRTRGHERMRLSVFRSNRHIYAQVIDDRNGKTIASVSDQAMKAAKKSRPLERARWVGKEIGTRAKAAHQESLRFDRGQYRYHGIVAAVSEGAREAGINI